MKELFEEVLFESRYLNVLQERARSESTGVPSGQRLYCFQKSQDWNTYGTTEATHDGQCAQRGVSEKGARRKQERPGENREIRHYWNDLSLGDMTD